MSRDVVNVTGEPAEVKKKGKKEKKVKGVVEEQVEMNEDDGA